jgi:hypothetical protein
VSGAHRASRHVVILESSSGGWRALCLRAHGGARASWHREQIWSRGANLLSLVHRDTWSTGYRQQLQDLAQWILDIGDGQTASDDGGELIQLRDDISLKK